MAKKALITGITGQDGSYLAELLLDKGYEVHGLIRKASTFNTHRIEHLFADPHEPGAGMFLHYGDLSDGRTGFLVPGRTAMSPDREVVQALCRKLSILIENPELRRRMGAEARRTAEGKFSIGRRNEALKRVLDEATGCPS